MYFIDTKSIQSLNVFKKNSKTKYQIMEMYYNLLES